MKSKRNVIFIGGTILLIISAFYYYNIIRPKVDATRLTPKEFSKKYINNAS